MNKLTKISVNKMRMMPLEWRIFMIKRRIWGALLLTPKV